MSSGKEKCICAERRRAVKRDGIRCRRIGVRGNVKQIAKEYARYHE